MTGPAPLACLREACAGLDRVGIAVSGGGDSIAALVLAVEALGAARVRAVTVDHGLRPEAAHEAAGVAALCARLGVPHAVLRWAEGAGGHRGNLMGAARAARYALIGDWARAGGLDAVILAHTQDDQAETVLMRLARGSGVDGVSGMAERRLAGGILWLRPLLGVSRAALRDALRTRGLSWVEDPTNADLRFQRPRARGALAALADLGIDAAGLAATAQRMRRARDALEAQTQAALDALVREDRGTLRIAAWPALPEIRDRMAAHLLMHLSGAWHRPRLEDLHRLLARGQGTLMGCLLQPEGDGWRLSREAVAVAALRGTPWDGRWRAEGPGPGEIRALGEDGLTRLSRQARAGQHPHWRETGLARAVLAGLPAIWHNDALIAAPLAAWPQGWHLSARPLAAIVADRALSH